jgi:phosphoglycolate phosphatase
MNKTVIVFDFDGTIVDSLRILIRILNQMADKFGFKKIESNDIEIIREMSAREILSVMKIPFYKLPQVESYIRIGISKEFINAHVQLGIKLVLESLKKKGFILGILSSNSEENIKQYLTKTNLNIFDFIYSGSSIFGKSRVINSMIKDKKLSKSTTMYVGDETRDIQAAQKSGIKVIAVSWGYNSASLLKKYKPDYLAEKPQDIIDAAYMM